MAKYRHELPQLSEKFFLTDGGLETTLIFQDKLDLPYFAAFDLLKDERGCAKLKAYFRPYIDIAITHKLGFILESPTWRASQDWGDKLGYPNDRLARMNQKAIDLLLEIRDEFENENSPMAISGCIGPRGDGYIPDETMASDIAADYHLAQIEALRDASADFVSAFTIPTTDEAIGITRAAQAVDIPVVISFTVETDGCLPSGAGLKEAIDRVDGETNRGPAYYMINCAHPTHFHNAIASREPWLERIRGIRANASSKSHAELDESETLDKGNPSELGLQYRELMGKLKNLNILGGCCGTDHRHVEAICSACVTR